MHQTARCWVGLDGTTIIAEMAVGHYFFLSILALDLPPLIFSWSKFKP